MKDYLMLVLAAVLLAGDFALSKLYQRHAGTSLKAGFRFNALLGLFTAVIFWAMGGFSLEITLYSTLMAIALSVLGMTYTLLGFRILKSGSMALYTLFLMVGGMTIPYVWGLLFLGEKDTMTPGSFWMRTAGLVVLIAAVAVSNIKPKGTKTNAGQILMCLGVFVLNGFVSVISKVHQVVTTPETVDATQFVMLSGVFKFLIAGVAYLIAATAEKHKNPPDVIRPKQRIILPLIALSAAVGGISYVLQLLGAANLPATVLYPFITGGSMVCSTLVGIFAFREKPSIGVIVGIALSFVGTLMFL